MILDVRLNYSVDGLDLDVTIRFADPAIGVQRKRVRLTPESFLNEIADARTFGFLADAQAMRAAGLGRGASMANTLVVDAGRVVNPEGLRFEDEFVRHKMLDAVGDLAMAGAPICGRFVADQRRDQLVSFCGVSNSFWSEPPDFLQR